METKTIVATFSLVAILFIWTVYEIKHRRPIDYDQHDYLINASTGEKVKPNQVFDVGIVLNITDEHVNETNSVQRLHELETVLRFGSWFEWDLFYSDPNELALSGLPVANQSKCGAELDWIKQQLASNPNYALVEGRLGLELTQLMDSFGKPPSEIYGGHVSWAGAYNRCLRTSLDGGRIKTRYCWAQMRPKQWPEKMPVRPQPRIRIGICLPDTCDTLSFDGQRQTIDWLIKFDLNDFYRNNLELESMQCLPDERSPIRRIGLGGRIYLWLLVGWLEIVLICTIIHELIRRKQKRIARESELAADESKQQHSMNTMFQKNGRKAIYSFQQENELDASGEILDQQWIQVMAKSFSIRSSIKSFKTNIFAVKTQDSIEQIRVDLSCLNAFKFIMAVTIVLGHSAFLTLRSTRIEEYRIRAGQSNLALITLSINRVVDSFFFLFGLLAAYTLLRKVRVSQLAAVSTWFGYNVAVLLRLMPLIVPVYCYSLLISPYMLAGPWWDYGLNKWTLKGHCNADPWYMVIPHFGRFNGLSFPACIPQNWFLVVYAQLSLIIPLLVYCLCKLPNQVAKLSLIVYISLVSCFYLGTRLVQQTVLNENNVVIYGAYLMEVIEKYEPLGMMDTLDRAGCISIGCYVGYLLRMYEIGQIRKWPKWLRTKTTALVVIVSHVSVLIFPFAISDLAKAANHEINLPEFTIAYIGSGFNWAIMNGFLAILATTTFRRAAIVRFFGHSFWCSANKLGYAIFLVHWEVLYTILSGSEHGRTFGLELDIFKLFSFVLLVCVLLAFCLHILIEAPINSMLNLIQLRQAHEPKEQPRGTDSQAKRHDVVAMNV